MTEEDAKAIVSYLRSVPAIQHAVPRVQVVAAKPGKGTPPHFACPRSSSGTNKTGEYIANHLAHCTECHSPGTTLDTTCARHLNEGGRIFKGAYGMVSAPSITAESLKAYTDDEIATIIVKGIRPNGTLLKGPMPVKAYSKMKQSDIDAIIAYLREPSSGTAE